MKILVELLATVFYMGRLPLAPGTWASLLAAVLVLLLPDTGGVTVLFLVSCAAGFMVAGPAVRQFRQKDPSCFVLDEFAGMLGALLFLPHTPAVIAAAFILFRYFDIYKPLGIRRIERWDHPAAVILDDLAAALYANLILRAVLGIWGMR